MWYSAGRVTELVLGLLQSWVAAGARAGKSVVEYCDWNCDFVRCAPHTNSEHSIAAENLKEIPESFVRLPRRRCYLRQRGTSENQQTQLTDNGHTMSLYRGGSEFHHKGSASELPASRQSGEI